MPEEERKSTGATIINVKQSFDDMPEKRKASMASWGKAYMTVGIAAIVVLVLLDRLTWMAATTMGVLVIAPGLFMIFPVGALALIKWMANAAVRLRGKKNGLRELRERIRMIENESYNGEDRREDGEERKDIWTDEQRQQRQGSQDHE